MLLTKIITFVQIHGDTARVTTAPYNFPTQSVTLIITTLLHGVTGVALTYSRCLSKEQGRKGQNTTKMFNHIQRCALISTFCVQETRRCIVITVSMAHIIARSTHWKLYTIHYATFVIRQQRKIHARNKWKGVCVKKLQHFYTNRHEEWGNERRIKD